MEYQAYHNRIKLRSAAVLVAFVLSAAPLAQPVLADTRGMQATFDLSESRPFRLDVDGESLFDITDLEYDTDYDSHLSFTNTTGKPLTLTLFDVENRLDDAKLYDQSELSITSDGKEIYSGSLAEARFAKAVPAGDTAEFTFTYSVPDKHVPDNFMMKSKLHARFHFQAGLDSNDNGGKKHNGGNGGNSNGSITADVTHDSNGTKVSLKNGGFQTGDIDIWIYVTAGAGACAAIIIILTRRNKKHGR